MEQDEHVWREESEGAKSVEGPDQAVVAESEEREGAAMDSSLKPR